VNVHPAGMDPVLNNSEPNRGGSWLGIVSEEGNQRSVRSGCLGFATGPSPNHRIKLSASREWNVAGLREKNSNTDIKR